MKEKEIRTNSLDLLMFRLIVKDDNDMVMEVKNGKRTDFMIFLCLKFTVYIIAQSASSQQSSETRAICEPKD